MHVYIIITVIILCMYIYSIILYVYECMYNNYGNYSMHVYIYSIILYMYMHVCIIIMVIILI